jgi:hypothetical protein
MMTNNEDLVIDVTVNGKKAKVELGKVEKATEAVGSTTKATSSRMKAGWLAVGGGITSAVAIMGVAISKAGDLTKATFGMSDGMKSYIQATSNATGMTQEMIAGFVQSGKTAGLSSGEIKKLTEQSIALGRAYPHESAETLNDNLIMLNKTGEAQGFIVDVLEQKYGKIDLTSISLADKLRAVEEATKGVNEKFQDTAGAKLDQTLTRSNNALVILGATALDAINKWGWIDAVNTGLSKIIRSMKTMTALDMKELTIEIQEQSEAVKKLRAEEAEAPLKSWNPLERTKGQIRASRRLAEQNLLQLEKRKAMLTEEVAVEDAKTSKIIANKEKELRATEEAEKNKQEALKQSEAFHDSTINSMADSITKFVMTGKLAFEDFAKGVIAQLVKIRVQQALVGAFTGTKIGSFFGLTTKTPEVKHTGGFIGIPSHHDGSIRSDERIAKLQVGEAVVNRAGATKNQEAIKAMNAGQSVGGDSGSVTTAEINFNVTAIDSASFNNYLVGNKNTIEGIINRSLQTNGSVRKTIKQVV